MSIGLNKSKAQVEIPSTVSSALSLLLAVTVIFIAASSGSQMSETIEGSIGYQVGDIRHNSFVTVTLEDEMWKASEEYPINDYDERSAYKVISYYYSTPGDTVYVDGEEIPKSEVRQDIRNYLKYKAEKVWSRGPESVNYRISLENPDSGRDERIQVPEESTISDSAVRSIFSISLHNGKEVRMNVLTQNARGGSGGTANE